MASKKSPKAAAEAAAPVKNLKTSDALADIAATQAEVQKTLSDLSAKVAAKLETVAQLDAAIEVKKTELAALGDIEDATETLDALNESIAATKDAEADAAQQRLVDRNREEEAFQYNLKKARAAEADAYAVSIEKRNREDAQRRSQVEAELKARVDAVTARETKMADLEKQVADIPNVVAKEVAKAEAILKNVLKRDYETQAQIASMQAASDAKVAAAEIQNLNLANSALKSQIEDLKRELHQANDRATAVATKALEAQSGKAALEAVQKAQEISASAQAKR
jgi:chromosome segregation ATPase